MTPPVRQAVVAVVGPSDATERLCRLAHDVGRLLAERGYVVVTGGGSGVMAAASAGASSSGGTTVALLPGTDPAAANEWAKVVIPTGLGEGRDLLVVRSAAAVVAVGGSWGTLAEVALATRAGIPVVGLETWLPYDAAGSRVDGVLAAADAAEAVGVVEQVLARAAGTPH
jgi:uncharacterized protein (TIGR00725 family)